MIKDLSPNLAQISGFSIVHNNSTPCVLLTLS